jgi:hypothetical protein
MATGMPTTGGGMLESMKVDTPEIAARKAAESSYGTRAADEVRQPAKADGLTTQEVLSSALGRSDPLTYLSGSNSSNVSAPSSLYGGPSGVVRVSQLEVQVQLVGMYHKLQVEAVYRTYMNVWVVIFKPLRD